MIIQGRINFRQVVVLLDAGSSVNVIPKNIISQIKGNHNVEYIKTKIATINGEIKVKLPIANRPYGTSFKDGTELKKQLDALLKTGIIKPSYSSYAAPITLAFKKEDNARARLCIDYRKLNAITKLDAEQIPRIDAVLDKLTHANFFSTIDLCSG
ncbi:retrotransposable element Tf2 protein type 1 [Trichonephila clavipes]|nr:retrotransposable element Tf2 protein type 1 [Trichonephila clavipes]